ncbi:hypothetical protein [Caedibacter taeniospiralis]|uniref:hypothetical protein n=1 Tax=Caedibacter taeniospiralis TaxID=28907 RepID=UPI0037BF6028
MEKRIEPLLGFKIFDQRSHAEDFTRGKLLVRQLRYFREIEDKNRKDKSEGATILVSGNDIKNFEIITNNKVINIGNDLIQLNVANNKDLNQFIYCISAIKFDLDKNKLEQNKFFLDKGFYGVFFRLDSFINFIGNNTSCLKEHGEMQYVEYPMYFSENPIFRKTSDYRSEQEYRLVFDSRCVVYSESFKKDSGFINIGDFSKNAMIFELSKTNSIPIELPDIRFKDRLVFETKNETKYGIINEI